MKKILLILLFPSIVFAMDTPIIFGGNNAPSTVSTQYTAPQSHHPSWNATEAARRLVIPVAGTISRLKVTDSGSASGNYAFTLFKNGSSTSLACNDSGASCQDIANTVSVSPGDTISLQSVPNSPDALYNNFQGTLMFSSTAGGEGIVLGGSAGALSALFYPIQSVSAGNATRNLTESAMPTSGTIGDLYVDLQTAPGVGTSYTFSIYQNGSAAGTSCTISGTNTTCNDTFLSIFFSAGDLITMEVTVSGSPASSQARWGMKWVPTTDGESIQLFGNTTLGSAGSTQYQGVVDGVSGSVNATETNRIQMMQVSEVKKLYADVVTSLGGNTAAFTVMANKTPSAVTCTISANTCNDTTHSYTAAFGDVIDMRLVKSAGISAGNGTHTGIVTYIAPTATPTPSGSTALRPLVGVGQ